MTTPSFVTETWLRQEFGLAYGSEVHLPNSAKLTPSASELLAERKIRVKYLDDDGRVYLPTDNVGKNTDSNPVNPLTGANEYTENHCSVCHSQVQQKGEYLTLLDRTSLVPKTHSRIRLRGKLDTLIAQTVLVQTQFNRTQTQPVLLRLLADLRSYMGNVLRSEVTGEKLLPLSMGEFDDKTLHKLSHQPLKYLGHDHVVPQVSHGENVAALNLLRALVREVELEAAKVFSTDIYELQREDIIKGLNRLSSALYVLMLMTVLSESGVEDVLNRVPRV